MRRKLYISTFISIFILCIFLKDALVSYLPFCSQNTQPRKNKTVEHLHVRFIDDSEYCIIYKQRQNTYLLSLSFPHWVSPATGSVFLARLGFLVEIIGKILKSASNDITVLDLSGKKEELKMKSPLERDFV